MIELLQLASGVKTDRVVSAQDISVPDDENFRRRNRKTRARHMISKKIIRSLSTFRFFLSWQSRWIFVGAFAEARVHACSERNCTLAKLFAQAVGSRQRLCPLLVRALSVKADLRTLLFEMRYMHAQEAN